MLIIIGLADMEISMTSTGKVSPQEMPQFYETSRREERIRQGKYPNSVDTTQAWPYNRSNLEAGLARTGKSGNESALTPAPTKTVLD